MASWFTGGDHFQRFAARDAAGGAGYGSVVIDLSARLYRRAACHRAAGGLSPETPAPGAACVPDHRLIRVVLGFPLLTALALQRITSAHSIVFIGLLPLMTALFGVLRGGERPRRAFWIFSLLGSLLVVGFALTQNAAASLSGDLLMLAAVIVCGLGYAEGAKLTRELGGWQVICWALVIALPLMLPASLLVQPASWHAISASSWAALGYVSLFSMLIGFIFWYKGLAAGGIAAVGQLQLLQPFFGLGLSAALLHETVSPLMLAVTLGVVLCVVGSRKFARQRVGEENGGNN